MELVLDLELIYAEQANDTITTKYNTLHSTSNFHRLRQKLRLFSVGGDESWKWPLLFVGSEFKPSESELNFAQVLLTPTRSFDGMQVHVTTIADSKTQQQFFFGWKYELASRTLETVAQNI